MKIALLGAPGAGKTKIARRMARRLNAELVMPPPAPPPGKQWKVIDGYLNRLHDRTNWAFGFNVDYRQNLQVIAERWTLEDEVAQRHQSSITCGSIYESIIYSAAPSLQIPQLDTEQLILSETEIARTLMGALGILEERYFDYTALFYLPLKNRDEETWEGVVDAKLPEILSGFFKYAVVLDGTDKQKVERAIDIIKNIYEMGATTADPDQSGIRDSEAASEDQES